MMVINIPGRGEFRLTHLGLDLNGTLALDGRLIDGVAQRLVALREHLEIRILTADTFGAAARIGDDLGLAIEHVHGAADKVAYVQRVGKANVVAIGNGANDAKMLAVAAIGIAILGPEGLARATLVAADIVVPSILVALDLLLNPKGLVATLRV
jgi:P-type E1-E2 ATPase